MRRRAWSEPERNNWSEVPGCQAELVIRLYPTSTANAHGTAANGAFAEIVPTDQNLTVIVIVWTWPALVHLRY
jgi:hypothetical protein